MVFHCFDSVHVNKDHKLKHGFHERKRIFNIPPFDSCLKNSIGEGHEFVNKSDFGQPNNIVSEEIDETAHSRDYLEHPDLGGHFLIVDNGVYFLDFVEPQKKSEYLPAI